jgi:preprotein translocase subunit YajC
MKNTIPYILSALIIFILGFAFYWYSYRPEKARKDCYQAVLQTSDFDLNYKSCLRHHGLDE